MVIRAVEMAIWQRQGDWSVILHSDRRNQFTSADYQRFLNRNTLAYSMSVVGHCTDNAAFEGLCSQLRRERVAHQSYRTRDEARADLFDYIERFHNPRMRRRVARQDLKFSALFKSSVEIGQKPLHSPRPLKPAAIEDGETSYPRRTYAAKSTVSLGIQGTLSSNIVMH